MSFILDALKKADEARHPTASSSLGGIRVPRLAPPRARWPWVLGGAVLLALNAGVIAYVVWPQAAGVTAPARDARAAASPAAPLGPSARSPEADVPASAPRPVAPALPAPAPRVAPELSVPAPRAAPAPVRTTTIVPVEPVKPIERSPAPARSEVGGAVVAASPPRVTAPPVIPPSRPGSAPAAPSLSPPVAPTPVSPAAPVALAPSRPAPVDPTRPAATTPPAPAAGGVDEISKLKLTVHVWADKPAERLVFINGRKYVQGDRIEDKVLLEEITQEGAMVSHEGRRSLLRPY